MAGVLAENKVSVVSGVPFHVGDVSQASPVFPAWDVRVCRWLLLAMCPSSGRVCSWLSCLVWGEVGGSDQRVFGLV